MMDRYQYAIEELSLSGAVGLGPCSKSTLYRWVSIINERLEAKKYDWRVKGNVSDMSISVREDWEASKMPAAGKDSKTHVDLAEGTQKPQGQLSNT